MSTTTITKISSSTVSSSTTFSSSLRRSQADISTFNVEAGESSCSCSSYVPTAALSSSSSSSSSSSFSSSSTLQPDNRPDTAICNDGLVRLCSTVSPSPPPLPAGDSAIDPDAVQCGLQPLLPQCLQPLSPQCLQPLSPQCLQPPKEMENFSQCRLQNDAASPARLQNVNPRSQRPTAPPPINTESLLAMSPYPIHSSYIVKEKVGQGTWGSVHIAVERTSGLERTVKKIPKRFTTEIARFRHEITFMKGLDHPNIVRLYETFEDYANIYMVMEYCRGGELFDRIIKSKYFTEATAATVMYQMLSCVCYIHRKNIAHRDLKPENFLFLSNDERSPMKLIDFGLAKRFNSRRRMRTKVGTLYYVAPEVLSGGYDESCDVWSAGVILYLLLCGVPPFNGPTDASIIQKIGAGEVQFQEPIWDKVTPLARDLVKLLLNKDPKRRPTASVACRHAWFKLFSPSFSTQLRFPRAVSLPGLHRHREPSEQDVREAGMTDGVLSITEGNRRTLCVARSSFTTTSEDLLPDSFPVYHPNLRMASPPCCGTSVIHVHSPSCPKSPGPTRHAPVAARDPPVPIPPLAFTASSSHHEDFVCRSSTTYSCQSVTLGELGILESRASRSSGLIESCSTDALLQLSVGKTNEPSCRHLLVFSNLVKKLVPRWKQFAMHNQLKRAALRVLAHQLDDGDQFNHLRTLFLALDSKNDGALSADELMDSTHVLLECQTFVSQTKEEQPYNKASTHDIMQSTVVSEFRSSSSGKGSGESYHLSSAQQGASSTPSSPHGFFSSAHSFASSECEGACPFSVPRNLHTAHPQTHLSSSLSLTSFQSVFPTVSIHSPTPLSPRCVSLSASAQSLLVDGDERVLKDPTTHDVDDNISSSSILPSPSSAAMDEETDYHLDHHPHHLAEDSGSDASMMDIEEMKLLVNGLALDGGDLLEFSDFIAATMEKELYMNESVLRAAFRVFDRDGDGYITSKELGSALGWLGPLCDRGIVFSSDPSILIRSTSETDLTEVIVHDEILRILKLCDLDGDGTIGFEDFMRVVECDTDLELLR